MTNNPRVIKLAPIFQQKIWGGRNLAEYFNNLPNGNIGECWLISAHPHGDTTVANGPFAGLPLSKVYNENRHLFGNDQSADFPLLVKIIDATDNLSIQVHPDDFYAKKCGEKHGKEEAWLILKAPPTKKIILGHHATSKEQFSALITNHKWDELLKHEYIDDHYFVPVSPGTIHSILSGTLLLEIQQSSDLTYRVYDYDRLDNGTKRVLHIKEALSVTNIPDTSIKPRLAPQLMTRKHQLYKGNYFVINTLKITNTYTFKNIAYYHLLIVTAGYGKINGNPCARGDAFILTTSKQPLTIEGNLELVITTPERND